MENQEETNRKHDDSTQQIELARRNLPILLDKQAAGTLTLQERALLNLIVGTKPESRPTINQHGAYLESLMAINLEG